MSNSEPHIFPVTTEDYEEIAVFLHNYRGKKRDASFWLDRFQHWWDNNPWFNSEVTRGFLLRNNHTVVGFIGAVPSPFQIGGERTISIAGTTWAVDNSCKNHALKLFARLSLAYENQILFMINPIKTTESFYPKFKYNHIIYQDRAYKTLYSGPCSRMLWKGCNNSYVQRWHTWLRTYATVLDRRLIRLNSSPSTSPLQFRLLDNAGSEFDHLWKATQGIVPTTRVRNAKYINWFCFGNPSLKKKLIGAYQDQALVGFAIFRDVYSDFGTGLECLDLWYNPEAEKLPQGILYFARKLAAENYINRVLFWEPFGYPQTQVSVSTDSWEKTDNVGFYRAPKEIVQSIAQLESFWATTDGDMGI